MPVVQCAGASARGGADPGAFSASRKRAYSGPAGSADANTPGGSNVTPVTDLPLPCGGRSPVPMRNDRTGGSGGVEWRAERQRQG